MDKNVYMNSPGKIYISSSGALCGTYALTTEFIAYGIMNVGPLSTYGNCINYNTINIDGNYIGISGTWTLNGNACIGCSFTCNAISHIPPVAIFASVQSVCVGSNITFIDKSLNSPGSWYWLFPGGVPSTSTKQNPAIKYQAAGTYPVTLIVESCNGSDTLKKMGYITVNPLPPVPTISASGSTTICKGDSIILTIKSQVPFLWSNGATSKSIVVKKTAFFFAAAVDSNGCSATSAIIGTIVNPLPIVNITANGKTILCNGDSVVLTANSGLTSYNWSNGDTTQSIKVKTAGTYFFVGTDTNSCSANSLPVGVSVHPPPNIDAGTDTVVCMGNSIQLNAIGGISYLWTPSTGLNNSTISNPVSSPPQITTYTVIASDGICSNSDSVTVFVNPLPTPIICNDTTITKGDVIQLNSGGGISYTWVPGTGLSDPTIHNPIASPPTTTIYTVIIKDQNSCTATESVTITVKDILCGDVYVPTAFSPNGDNQNDVLYVRSNCLSSLHFLIYDRWGEQVFETSIQSYGWDGTFRDKICNSDVYTYYLNCTLLNGSVVSKKGNITLVR